MTAQKGSLDMKRFLGMSCVVLALSACGGGGSTDAGADTGGAAALPLLSIGTVAMPEAMPADYSCMGTRTEPAAGADISVDMNLVFFGSDGEQARSTRVWFFPDNIIQDTCMPPCQD